MFLVGQIHPTETQFLANYFMGFGEEVTILDPVQVKQAYVESIMRIQKISRIDCGTVNNLMCKMHIREEEKPLIFKSRVFLRTSCPFP